MICTIPPKYGHIRPITCAGQSGIPRCADGELMGIRGLGEAIPNSAKLPPPCPSLPGQTSDILTVDRGQHPTMSLEIFWFLFTLLLISNILRRNELWYSWVGLILGEFWGLLTEMTWIMSHCFHKYEIEAIYFFSWMTPLKAMMIIISTRQSLALKNVGLFVVGEGRQICRRRPSIEVNWVIK